LKLLKSFENFEKGNRIMIPCGSR